MRYPLPWNRLNCSTHQPIIFDVALAERHRWAKNEKEFWIKYYEQHLKGKTRVRSDGTRVQFGDLVRFSAYPRNYSAYIGVSCDSFPRIFPRWLQSSPRNFCVLHGTCPNCANLRQQSCMLNPMHTCFFMTADLPQFPADDEDDEDDDDNGSEQEARSRTRNNKNATLYKRQKNVVNICVSGSNRRHETLAEALATTAAFQTPPPPIKVDPLNSSSGSSSNSSSNDKNNNSSKNSSLVVQVSVFLRKSAMPEPYLQRNVSHFVRLVTENKFMDFQRKMSQCSILLPLIDPEHNPGHFPNKGGKLTGSIPQAIAYQVPTVMHSELHAVYHKELTAPSLTYTNTSGLTEALVKMVQLVTMTRQQ